VSGGVEVAAPGSLVPSFWIAVARIESAGGAFAFEDEVDSAKVGRGVQAGAGRAVVSSGHDAPPVSVWLGDWLRERPAVGPIALAHTRAERFFDGGRACWRWGPEVEKMLGDA
jgi:hypothetical protein